MLVSDNDTASECSLHISVFPDCRNRLLIAIVRHPIGRPFGSLRAWVCIHVKLSISNPIVAKVSHKNRTS